MKDDPILVEPNFWSKTTFIQLGYSVWVNQVSVLVGLAFGFSSVTVEQLRKPGALFKTTSDELSWFVSSLSIIAPFGCISSGFIMDRIGRSWMMVLCLVPTVCGWFYTGFASSASHLIVGRIITGLGVGMSVSPPRSFITEITLPKMRGVAGVISTIAVSTGLTMQGLFGKIFDWKTICFMCAAYSTSLMLLNMLLPETPYFILMSGDMIKTRKALRRIRAKNYDDEPEFNSMQLFRRNNNLRQLDIKDTFRKLFTPYACKPYCTILVFVILTQLSGISVMLFWTVDVLKDSRLSFDPYTGNIILGMTRIVTGIGASVLIYWVPRRMLAIVPALCIGLLCISLGIFVKVTLKPSIIPIFGYVLYMCLAGVAYYSLPQMMLFELVPLEIRGLLGGINDAQIFTLIFLATKFYPVIRAAIGFPTTLIFFGVSSLIDCVYLYIFLPETKDLTLQEIEEFYRSSRPTLSHRFPKLTLRRQ